MYWGPFLKCLLRELTWVPLIFDVKDPCQAVGVFFVCYPQNDPGKPWAQ